jgi:phage-related tail fiber protein
MPERDPIDDDTALQRAAHSVVKSEVVTATGRLSMILALPVLIGLSGWVLSTTIDTTKAVVELTERVSAINSRVSTVEKVTADTNTDLSASRALRQKDWNEIRERLTRVETQNGILLQSLRDVVLKLDSIADRLPRKEGMLVPPERQFNGGLKDQDRIPAAQ